MINNNFISVLGLCSFAVIKICLSGKSLDVVIPPSPNPHQFYLHIPRPVLNITMEMKSYTGVFFEMEDLKIISTNSHLFGNIK